MILYNLLAHKLRGFDMLSHNNKQNEDFFRKFWLGIEKRDERSKKHNSQQEDFFIGFLQLLEEQKRLKLEQEIFALKKRALRIKYVSFFLMVPFPLVMAMQLASIYSNPYVITIIMVNLSILSLACTVYSILNTRRINEKEEELRFLEDTEKLEKDNNAFDRSHYLEWVGTSMVALTTMDWIHNANFSIEDYFNGLSIVAGVLDVIGEFAGNEVMLTSNILGVVLSFAGFLSTCKKPDRTQDIISSGFILLGSSILLARRVMLMEPTSVLAVYSTLGLVGILCIMAGCALSIYSYSSKLKDVKIKEANKEIDKALDTKQLIH